MPYYRAAIGETMSKRVYKFTLAQYGISSLQEKRLKVSTIADLNDPFDLCALDTTDPVISDAWTG